MCVKEYSDLFLNLIIEYEPILAFIFVKGNYPHGGKSLRKIPAWWEEFEKIPAWRGKVGIVLILINPALQEKFGIVLILHGRRNT
jgi:hypothetical protein